MTQGFNGERIVEYLLSWFRWLIDGLISLVTGADGGNLLHWLSESWIALLTILLIIGISVNLVIFFIRWRPHWWWFAKKRMVLDDSLFETPAKKKESGNITGKDIFAVKKK